MLINLKVKTLDARTHDFSIDNELTIRQFKDQIAVKTNIAAENQRIIYQGRVLADDKQVKEYDVDGKVLHVAERPPFSQRGANATNNDEPMRNFRNMPGGRPRNMRNSPYFRALDGMLVGTMAIPVNNGNLTAAGTRTPPNRFPNSSSFCINRITVAQHMIDCANNIAAYLENPEIGLNNQPLDILQRGHWTMESTVVEVGVSTDMPRNNNIIDMVQDAVSAALSRNASGRNYTVVQLPTVYTNEGGAENSQQPQQSRDGGNEANSAEVGAASGTARSSESSEETTAAAAAVIIEDVTVTDEDERSASPQSSEDAGGAGAETDGAMGGAAAPAAAGAADDASNVNVTGVDSRRRTRPQVLATVIQRYRMVETRLAPFIDRYHEILQQDPEFPDQDNVGRENAQRTFDRVSEALHYLSHAQHAISDLMLDMSQPGPRVLTCRPILVEQSGYIRSNNIFTPNIVAAPFTELMPQVPALAHAISPPANAAATNAAATNVAATNVAATNAAATNVAATNAAAGPSVPNVDAAAATTQAEQQAANLLNIDQLIESIATERDGWMRGSAAPGTAPAPVGTQRTQTPSRPAAATPGFHATAVPVLSYQSTPVGTPPVGQAPNATHDELLEEVEGDERMLADAAAALVAGLGQHRAEDVEDPVDEPMVAPPSASGTQSQPQEQQQQQGQQQQGQQQQSTNPYMRIARLIQAVANSATNDADLRLEFNMPNVINLPVHVITAALHPPAAGNTGTETATGTATAAAGAASESTTSATASAPTATVLNAVAASTSSGTRSGDQRANTLPTTATQTRSTARPQIQIGGNNNWAGRIAPTHTAFDRFLPCNSHHIREVEPPLVQQQQPTTTTQTNNNNTSNNNNISSSSSATNTIGSSGNNNRRGASNPTNYAIGLGGTSAFNAAAAAAAATAAAADAVITAATAVGVNTAAASTNAAVAADGNGATLSVTVGNNSNNTTETSSGSQASRNLRAQVRSFLHQTVFEGGPINALTIPTAIDRALEWFADSLLYLRQYERPEYNSHDSVCNMLRRSLRLIIALCNDPSHCNVHFEHRLKQICEQFRLRLYSVLFLCLGSANAELFWRQLMRLLCVPLRSNFRNEALQFLCIYIDPTIPAQADTADAQQFLVLRNPEQAPLPTDDDLQQEQEQQPTESEQQSLDNDIEMAEVASSSNSSSAIEMEPALPAVTPGSEPWHNSFPNDWLPVITRDLQTQTEQDRPQPPYSDAYISGMSAKRRKIIQTEKPPTNVECLIASGVQRAMQRSGLSGTASNPAVNPDVVVNAIAHDAIVQASYTDAVRMNARERVKQDVDYQPSKYPQIAKFTELK